MKHALLFSFLLASVALAEPATPLTSLAKMPVKEITVFKDGHAFILHAGRMPTDANGNVVIDALPNPVLGTFWPHSTNKDVKLVSVTASARKVKLDRTALSVRELIEANVGQQVSITELPVGAGQDAQPLTYSATIVSIPTQSGEELEATSPPNTGEKLPNKGNIVLLKTANGIKAVDFGRIVDVTFDKAPAAKLSTEEFRNLMTLRLDWGGKDVQKEAEVGMMYLQKGIRWIPNYKVTIDGKGQATLKLQATLINELTDLEDVTAHLVIGVPSFAFAQTPDPMALQGVGAQLSQYFVNPGDVGGNFDNRMSNAFSNSIQTQVARMGEQQLRGNPGNAAVAVDLGPDIPSQGKSEDLFLFSVKKISLKKGQRMVIPIAEWTVSYKDVYTLDVPVTPPPEVMRSFNTQQQAELIRSLRSPKVQHKVRLFNKTEAPFTTAPAMIVQNDRLIAQGMMTYTAPGAAVDIDLTTAVDVSVKKTDEETARTPDAARWHNESFVRVDVSGKITLTSFSKDPIEVEVSRAIMGNIDQAGQDGKKQMLNLLEDASFMPSSRVDAPYWYGWYNWPHWWNRFNGVGRITWNLKLEQGKPAELTYAWHYFWR